MLKVIPIPGMGQSVPRINELWYCNENIPFMELLEILIINFMQNSLSASVVLFVMC